MLSRFELFVIFRNQVRDRARARRALLLEAACRALAGLAGDGDGADADAWGLAGLGADIDVVLTAGNPARRGQVAEEILVTEGVPAELARAARERFELEPAAMSKVAQALVAADALVAILVAADPEDPMDGPFVAHKLARAARREDEGARRALTCLDLLGIDLGAAATAVLAATREVE